MFQALKLWWALPMFQALKFWWVLPMFQALKLCASDVSMHETFHNQSIMGRIHLRVGLGRVRCVGRVRGRGALVVGRVRAPALSCAWACAVLCAGAWAVCVGRRGYVHGGRRGHVYGVLRTICIVLYNIMASYGVIHLATVH